MAAELGFRPGAIVTVSPGRSGGAADVAVGNGRASDIPGYLAALVAAQAFDHGAHPAAMNEPYFGRILSRIG